MGGEVSLSVKILKIDDNIEPLGVLPTRLFYV